ncbi:MAG: hypothetical protein Q7U54_01270 [Bacteroidales bacterium]|nr:hypothetical protein [Bacteroidales bacterium]
MKKNILLIAMILLVGITTSLFAQKDRTLSNGFSVNLIIGFPSSNYALTSDGKMDGYSMLDSDIMGSDYKLSSLFGVQIGNRWYFKPKEKYGFGLMVNWLDFAMGVKSGTIDGTEWARAVIDFSFLEVGPVGTFVLADNLALDAYYNLRPTVLSSATVFTSSGEEDFTYAYVGVGVSHAIGAAVRYKIFNFGMEYTLGSINSKGTFSGSSSDETLDDQKNMVNSFRLKFGLKF